MAFLRDLSDGLGRIHPLGDHSTLGRDPGNAVVLHDLRVSRRHVSITRTEDGAWVLTDLGSTHGTIVGGRRVTTATLADGDEIHIGSCVLRFERGEPDPGEAAGFDRIAVSDEPRFLPAGQITDERLLRRDYEKLRAAHELTRSLGVEQDLDAIFDRILDVAISLLGADRGAILVNDPETGLPGRQLARHRTGRWHEPTLSVTVINEAISSKSGVLSADAGLDLRFQRSQSVLAVCLRSTMCAPMLYQGDVVGAIYLDSREADLFREKDLGLLTSIAGQAALAIRAATLRERIREVVAEERRRLQGVVADLPTGLILLDRDLRIVLTNAAADRMLPLLSGARTGEILERLGSRAVAELVGADTEGRQEIEVTGPPRRVFVVAIAGLRRADGEIVILLDDVTEERRREAVMAREDRMSLVGQLAGGIAHDFNNLLSVILSYADFLRQELTDPTMCQDASAIIEAGQRATALVRQLMLFARREPETANLVHLNNVLGGMEMLVRRALGASIQLRLDLDPSLLRVRADGSKLEQVIMNLVVNARDAMEAGGQLTISTSNVEWSGDVSYHGQPLAAGRYVILRVADTGTGMTPEVAARVFEPFFTTKGPSRGTGLGLATVYGIVKQTGGVISVDTAPGRGSSFEICLPATEALAADVAERGRASDAGGGGTDGVLVLLVEDEPAMREIAGRMLRRAGYAVIEAPDGAEALRLCEEHHERLRLVLTDVIMPNVSGKQLGQQLQRRWPSLPVVFMTGYSFDEAVFEDIAGPPRVIQKPFTYQQLVAEVREAIVARPDASARG